MKKTVSLLAVLSLMTGPSVYAAIGDMIWIGVRDPGPDLTNPQKSAVAVLINSDLGSGVASKLSVEQCTQDMKTPPTWACSVSAELTLTDDQYADGRLAEEIQPGQATTVVTKTFKPSADYTAFVLSVFNKDADNEVYSWIVERDEDVPTTIHSGYWPIETGTTTEFRAADSSIPTQVLRPIGRVSE